jgi:hypothetical protein
VEGTNAAGDEIEATNATEADTDSTIAELVSRARAAMGIFEHYDQEQVDEVVQAVAWAIIKRRERRGAGAARGRGHGPRQIRGQGR